MNPGACSLAHAAGPVHDIRLLSGSDGVVFGVPGGALNARDWLAITQHPEVGADLLTGLGVRAVAEMGAAHHKGVDGRG